MFIFFRILILRDLTSVSVSLEMEPELEDIIMELASESSLVTIFPFSVHDLESNVLVRRSRGHLQNTKIPVV